MGGAPVSQAVPQAAWELFRHSIYYLGLLFAAMAVDRLVAL
jgi:hypothetical protein